MNRNFILSLYLFSKRIIIHIRYILDILFFPVWSETKTSVKIFRCWGFFPSFSPFKSIDSCIFFFNDHFSPLNGFYISFWFKFYFDAFALFTTVFCLFAFSYYVFVQLVIFKVSESFYIRCLSYSIWLDRVYLDSLRAFLYFNLFIFIVTIEIFSLIIFATQLECFYAISFKRFSVFGVFSFYFFLWTWLLVSFELLKI